MEDSMILIGIAIVILLIGIMYTLQTRKPKEYKPSEMALFTPKADCTTVIPVPIHAATCDHNWEIIIDHTLEVGHEKKMVAVLSCRNCGLIDKTVQVTSPQPEPLPPPPCKHEWETQIDQTLEVPHEQKIVVIMTCRVCGEVNKTVETTSKPAAGGKSECRHKWETEKKVELLSAYEQMLKSISVKTEYGKCKVKSDEKLSLNLDKAPAWMFRKTYVSLRICSACGEIDKTITSNFELDENPNGIMPDVPEVTDDEDEDDEPVKHRREG